LSCSTVATEISAPAVSAAPLPIPAKAPGPAERIAVGREPRAAAPAEPNRGVALGLVPATERHYRVQELAALWRLSANTIIGMFANEPGVLNAGKGKKRVLSIPESIVTRVHGRWTAQRIADKPLKTPRARRNPLRVIRLRDLHGRMPKKPRNIIKGEFAA
jgi:hypothetical protein